MSAKGKENLRRIVMEAFSEGKLDVLDEVLTPDFKNQTAPPGLDRGIEGVKQVITMERTGFPDLQYEVVREIEEGDMIAQHCKVTGTHQGTIFGTGATGRRVMWYEIHIARMENDLCAEHWACNDMHSVWVQIGRAQPPMVVPAGAAS